MKPAAIFEIFCNKAEFGVSVAVGVGVDVSVFVGVLVGINVLVDVRVLVRVDVGVFVRVTVGVDVGGPATVKGASERSTMLPTPTSYAMTSIMYWVPGGTETYQSYEPVLGMLFAIQDKQDGQVLYPMVIMSILGELSQVMVWVVPTDHISPPLGEVIATQRLGFLVGVLVIVLVFDGVRVLVRVFVIVLVLVGVRVEVRVFVPVIVGVSVFVGVVVLAGEGVSEGISVGVCVNVRKSVAVGSTVGTIVSVSVSADVSIGMGVSA